MWYKEYIIEFFIGVTKMWRFECITNLIKICNKPEDEFLSWEELQELFHKVSDLLKDFVVDLGHSDKVIVFEKSNTEKVLQILKDNYIENFEFIER